MVIITSRKEWQYKYFYIYFNQASSLRFVLGEFFFQIEEIYMKIQRNYKRFFRNFRHVFCFFLNFQNAFQNFQKFYSFFCFITQFGAKYSYGFRKKKNRLEPWPGHSRNWNQFWHNFEKFISFYSIQILYCTNKIFGHLDNVVWTLDISKFWLFSNWNSDTWRN